MKILNLISFIIIIQPNLFANCDGFNWHHDINIEDCNINDINALNQFIANSADSLELDMDVNFDGKIDALELGWQLWEDGRLIHWICQEVPSPYYFYEYNCGLNGLIPEEIGNLDAIVKLRLQNNNLSGKIPNSICNLNNYHDGSYWFNLEENSLCPPYPQCIEEYLGKQNIDLCK